VFREFNCVFGPGFRPRSAKLAHFLLKHFEHRLISLLCATMGTRRHRHPEGEPLTKSNRIPMVPPDLEPALVEALELSSLALAVTDDVGLLWMNQAASKLLGVGEASGSNSMPLGRELERAMFAATYVEGAESGLDAFASESSLKLNDGTDLPVGVAAIPLDTDGHSRLGLIIDLRASRTAEEAVRRAEERFERLVESMLASVWLMRQRHVVYANRAAAELFGVDRNLLIGIDIAEFFQREELNTLNDNLERVERGESVLPHEYHVVTRQGATIVIELSWVTLEHEGEPTILSFGRDVTARRHEEQRLLQADRLSALGMLASGMAHAINNPLTYVLLNLDHLSRRLPGVAGDAESASDVMARLVEAREGAERMATIVKRMRTFARTDESSTRVLELRSVLESVVELVGHEVRHRGKLTTRFENVPPVLANEAKIEQVCLGLLLFATQMLPDDTVKRHEVRLSLVADERQFAVFEIVCEGCNTAELDIERLFDPFAPRDGGKMLGFGLSLCSSLVEQLGGQLAAEALPGTGLLLRMAIPCVPLHRLMPESTLPSTPPSTLPPENRGKARVLVVDDDPGVGRALRLMLEDEHDVKSLVRPREALQELLGDSSYDLVFCDLMMPELSGMDIYQVLRFNRPGYESRIVFMTGGAFTPSARRFLEQVPNPRIEKPFNLRTLQRLVERSARLHH